MPCKSGRGIQQCEMPRPWVSYADFIFAHHAILLHER